MAVLILAPPPRPAPQRALPNPNSLALGTKLKALRQRVGKTQEEVGRAIDRDARTVSHVENGRIHFRVADRGKWARALGVSDTELEVALGLGLAPSDPSTDRLRAEVTALLGPDQGDLIAEVVEELADWPDRERRDILAMFKVQTFNWPRRPSAPDHDDPETHSLN